MSPAEVRIAVAEETARRPLVVVALLVLLLAVGTVFRCRGLDAAGFSEDEIHKLQAVRGYSLGDWTANGEHPMLMKVMMWASSEGAAAWNQGRGDGREAISPEAALRLPNALAGALAIVPLFLLARRFFSPATGMWAAAFLALDVNATGINRIGKEDSFLVLFLLTGAWLYEEARRRHLAGGHPPHWLYAASGAAFGLMMASKYMPYYLGLWALFGLAAAAEAKWARRPIPHDGDTVHQRASAWFFLAMAGAFVLANPVILVPDTWRYVFHYLGGKTITHHGAFFNGQVYVNTIGATPWGLPWHFYLTYLFTKTPLPVLLAIGVGVAELVRRPRERGAVFARVFLIFYLLPASLMAAKFARYLLPTLVVLDLVAALGIVRTFEIIGGGRRSSARRLAVVALAVVMIAAPLVAQARSSPYPSVYRNALGHRMSPGALMFPNDELYDVGMREAVAWIARRAAPGASIASDAPGVVAEYLRRYRRTDIEARSLSMAGPARPPTESWVLAQDSHACFESEQVVRQLRRRQPSVFTVRARGAVAVETFRLPW